MPHSNRFRNQSEQWAHKARNRTRRLSDNASTRSYQDNTTNFAMNNFFGHFRNPYTASGRKARTLYENSLQSPLDNSMLATSEMNRNYRRIHQLALSRYFDNLKTSPQNER